MKDLYYYLTFAKKIVLSYRRKKPNHNVPYSEDIVSYVATKIMQAENRYDETKVSQSKKLSSTPHQCHQHYLRQCAIFAIKAYIYQEKKKHKDSLFTDIDANRFSIIDKDSKTPLEILCERESKQEISNILSTYINSSGLTKNEIKLLEDYRTGKTISDIARENNISPQAVSMSYHNAINKISSLTNNV